VVSFDETNLVSNAGLLPAAALAQRIDLGGLIDSRLGLAKHGANSCAKALSVIGSMLVGGDSIDDAGGGDVGGAHDRGVVSGVCGVAVRGGGVAGRVRRGPSGERELLVPVRVQPCRP